MSPLKAAFRSLRYLVRYLRNAKKIIMGACPRIGILFKIEKFKKNKHSHMFDIASIIFLEFRRVWAKGHSRTASW